MSNLFLSTKYAYHSILTRILLLKHLSENVSVNIILPVGFVGIIAHNEQFVSCYRLSIPEYRFCYKFEVKDICMNM